MLKNLYSNTDKSNQQKIENSHSKLLEDGLYYLQMRLPTNKITQAYIDNLKSLIEQEETKIEIKEAKKKDLDSILYLHNRIWDDSHILFVPIDKVTIEILFDYPETKILIASKNREDIGYIIIDYDGPDRQYGMIDGMGILPKFQGKTIGRILCLSAWNYIKKLNTQEIRCEVFIENKKCFQFLKFLGFELYKINKYHY